jgi:hypothetical protein
MNKLRSGGRGWRRLIETLFGPFKRLRDQIGIQIKELIIDPLRGPNVSSRSFRIEDGESPVTVCAGRAGVHLSILLAAFFLAACSGVVDESGRPSLDNSTSLTSEAPSREGAGTAHLVTTAVSATGPSTITVRLLPNEPVKEIAAREVLLVGSPQEPTL